MERHGELGEKILKQKLLLESKLNLETYLKASQVSCAPTRGESVAGSYSCRWEISFREWWLFWLWLCVCWFSFQEFCLWLILVRWFWLCLRLRWKAPFVSDILRPVSDPAGSEVQFLTKNLALIRRKLDSSHCNTRMRIRITPHNSRWGEKGGKRREQISEISFWFWNTAQKYDAHRSRPSWRGWSLLLISPYFV